MLTLQGDVQMAVTVLIILGDRIAAHVDEVTREHWFMSYIGEYSHTWSPKMFFSCC